MYISTTFNDSSGPFNWPALACHAQLAFRGRWMLRLAFPTQLPLLLLVLFRYLSMGVPWQKRKRDIQFSNQIEPSG